MSTPVTLGSAHGLQGLVELVYVQAANDLLYNKMLPLQSALAQTQRAIDALAELQTLKNMVTVQEKPPFVFDYASDFGGTRSGYTSAYKAAASAYFNTPATITYNVSIPDFNTRLQAAHVTIGDIVNKLSAIGGISGTDATSLLAKLKIVQNDIENNTAGPTGFDATKWLFDNYNSTGAGASSSGAIQQRLTNAITAGESLNTTQTEKVRSYLFLFEEYYKSASAILQQMTQIIQKMAQNIK